MKAIFFSLGLVFCTASVCQPKEIKKTISKYIKETLKENKGTSGEKYMVFYLELEPFDSINHKTCFKVSYILNSFSLDQFMDGFEAYESIRGRHVWIYSERKNSTEMEAMGFEKVSFKKRVEVAQFLFPCIPFSGFTSSPNFFYGCLEEGTVTGKIYENNEPIED